MHERLLPSALNEDDNKRDSKKQIMDKLTCPVGTVGENDIDIAEL